jgi:diacylglycerol kinase
MEQNKSMHPTSRLKSFSFAINGLYLLLKEEPNTRLHALATITVIAGGIFRHFAAWQWVAALFAIGLVWITEALNTCIENLCNFTCDNKLHPAIKVIKDISAAAVLLAAIVSFAIGIIIFIS